MEDNPCAEVVSGHRLGKWQAERKYDYMALAERFAVSAVCSCGSTLRKAFFVSDELLISLPSKEYLSPVYMYIIDAAEGIIKNHSSLEYMAGSMAEVKSFFSDIGYEPTVYEPSESVALANAAEKLPGVEYIVRCPGTMDPGTMDESPCPSTQPIYYIIQHLNDSHRWTREAIADWLEEIHDPTGENGPNINFEMEDSQ